MSSVHLWPPGTVVDAILATGVTGVALTRDYPLIYLMVKSIKRERSRRAVAGIAGECGRNMACIFASGGNAMAGITGTRKNSIMVKRPVPGTVALVAGSGWRVGSAWPGGPDPADDMASLAGPRGNAGMVKTSRYPCRGSMALVTGGVSHHMSCGFTGCGDTVVAGDAAARCHANVIESCTGPGHL